MTGKKAQSKMESPKDVLSGNARGKQQPRDVIAGLSAESAVGDVERVTHSHKDELDIMSFRLKPRRSSS